VKSLKIDEINDIDEAVEYHHEYMVRVGIIRKKYNELQRTINELSNEISEMERKHSFLYFGSSEEPYILKRIGELYLEKEDAVWEEKEESAEA
jgi:CII-binding regulator of phage lambda lysogenization HflD